MSHISLCLFFFNKSHFFCRNGLSVGINIGGILSSRKATCQKELGFIVCGVCLFVASAVLCLPESRHSPTYQIDISCCPVVCLHSLPHFPLASWEVCVRTEMQYPKITTGESLQKVHVSFPFLSFCPLMHIHKSITPVI